MTLLWWLRYPFLLLVLTVAALLVFSNLWEDR
jgi:hypothetical protein